MKSKNLYAAAGVFACLMIISLVCCFWGDREFWGKVTFSNFIIGIAIAKLAEQVEKNEENK